MKKILIGEVLLFAILVLSFSEAYARSVHLLPRPQQLFIKEEGYFELNRPVSLSDPTHCTLLLDFLETTGCSVDPDASASIEVALVECIDGSSDYELAGYPNEAYSLNVTEDSISISAVTPTGVIRAVSTLFQLAEGYHGHARIEVLFMKDWPAFKLRGFMHDTGRSFITVDEIKKELDLLSIFKINTFHWHLTENQAWRFEVKAYPQLTSASSMTRFAGQYYTQDQCREVEAYAAERGIVIIPEIDMPGHSEAFTRAMGHSMQTERGVDELRVILDEVADVFHRAPYIHIGADEQTITYPGFLDTIIDEVHALGKRVIVWNPISGVTISPDSGIDMTQMWSTAGRVVRGIPSIDCRYNYTNHFDVFADLVGIYKSNIYYRSCGSPDVAGTISAYWNDRKMPNEKDILSQNNFYANVLASAERAWIGGGKRYIEEGGVVLPNEGDEYEEYADWEHRFLYHKAHRLSGEPIPYVKQTHVRWCVTDAFPNNGDAKASFPPEIEGPRDSYNYEGETYNTSVLTGAGIYLRHTWGDIVPAHFKGTQPNVTAYAWTFVYSPESREAGALIEFQNYSRSEKDLAPEAGRWDRKGSRIWINDVEIFPPAWANSGKDITHETNLMNENMTARSPQKVYLKVGWNKVFLKLPYVPVQGIRLNKWMFTFVLTDLDGRNALDDIIYSPVLKL